MSRDPRTFRAGRTLPVLYLVALLCSAVAPGLPLEAQAVVDHAGLFGEEARAEASGMLARLKTETGLEIFVETVQNTGENPAGSFALERARERGIYGAYIMVAVDSRKIEIKVASSLRESLTPELVENMREAMTLAFRDERYDRGLLDLAELATENLAGLRVSRPVDPGPAPASGSGRITPAGRWLFTGLAGALLSLAFLSRILLPGLALLRNYATAEKSA